MFKVSSSEFNVSGYFEALPGRELGTGGLLRRESYANISCTFPLGILDLDLFLALFALNLYPPVRPSTLVERGVAVCFEDS